MQTSHIQQAISILEDCGHQQELIELIKGRADLQEQETISKQIIRLNSVTPTGMKNYLERARGLLEESMKGVNPFDKYKPEVPTGYFLKPGQQEFLEFEKEGVKQLKDTGIVLIAGGLGERLGYSGIKIDLPVCTIEEDYCYLKYYAQYVHAIRDRALPFVPEAERASFYVPFCIMVSDDTNDRTIALLEKFNYFGLGKDKVDIIKQENVPALINNSAKIAVDTQNFRVVTKPHGHGDVHNLLFDSGVAKKWNDMGKKWMVFIQDTNALAMKALPSILGVSAQNNWQMNTVCVPRMPGESMGAICRLVDEADPSKEIVINVEYNQLDALLKAKWNKEGDVKNEQGYSHFPGNTNTLVFKIPEYYENLKKTGGVIPEFVNPKYANAEKTLFKSPTRLECMMQDYPKLLSSVGEVGFTMYETWYCFSPAKNNIKDAAACITKGIPSYGAAEAEFNFYNWTNKMLQLVGVDVQYASQKQDFNGMQFAFGPKVLLDPMFAITYDELETKFKGKNKLSKEASLVLLEKEVYFENLDIDQGTLVCKNGGKQPKGKIVFQPCDMLNDTEIYKIRGYLPVHQ
mmetsp:Transcript_11854/g.20046  ORF Transcript_11854/g.20046 Transcript_11854/m.20046 type:complete len:574 (-) Transcript_11854:171-1892(-)